LYWDFKLFHTVFRFCPKESFRKLIKSVSGTRKFSSCEAMLKRTTVECTLGGGEKASGGSVNSFSTRPYNCVVAESSP
jgi:hypothetical protein